MLSGEAYKVYVSVFVEHRSDGTMLPREIIWEDGQKYEIDRVIDIRPAYAAKAGGQGDRYTIQVNGARTYLYLNLTSRMNLLKNILSYSVTRLILLASMYRNGYRL